jgi:hypothetical protein
MGGSFWQPRMSLRWFPTAGASQFDSAGVFFGSGTLRNCYHKIGSECIGFDQYIALEANAMAANPASHHLSMSHRNSVWKNWIRRREVFHGGPLGLEIDNNIKNMPMLTA